MLTAFFAMIVSENFNDKWLLVIEICLRASSWKVNKTRCDLLALEQLRARIPDPGASQGIVPFHSGKQPPVLRGLMLDVFWMFFFPGMARLHQTEVWKDVVYRQTRGDNVWWWWGWWGWCAGYIQRGVEVMSRQSSWSPALSSQNARLSGTSPNVRKPTGEPFKQSPRFVFDVLQNTQVWFVNITSALFWLGQCGARLTAWTSIRSHCLEIPLEQTQWIVMGLGC